MKRVKILSAGLLVAFCCSSTTNVPTYQEKEKKVRGVKQDRAKDVNYLIEHNGRIIVKNDREQALRAKRLQALLSSINTVPLNQN